MSRASRITYNSKLSVKENAKKNGVSEAGIRYYIQANGIDRRYEQKSKVVNACKRYLKKHPGATKNEIHRELGYAVSTIRGYWDYITGKKELEHNQTKQQKQSSKYESLLSNIPLNEIHQYLDKSISASDKTLKVNKGDELWSDVLKEIPNVLKQADETDVTQFREFLLEKPDMPMLFVASGGLSSFPPMLYGMNKGVGIALTPIQFSALSDEAVKSSRIMLSSESGRNDDIKYASKRAVELNPGNTACITTHDTPNNKLLNNLRGTSARVFLFKSAGKSGFTSIRGKFYRAALYLKAFAGIDFISSLIDVDLIPEHCFRYELNKDEGEPINLDKIEHFCVLYGGYGKPVADDFEGTMVESGIASVQVSDYRNFCHGRFMFPTNHTENNKEPRFNSNVAMVLLVSPREKILVEQIRLNAIPSKTPVIIIETKHESAVGTLDMLIKANVLIGYISEQCKKINPYSPPNYNAQDIDKRKPIYGVKFLGELQRNEKLHYLDSTVAKPQRQTKKKAVDVGELKTLIDEMKEVEKQNGKSLQYLPQPTIDKLTRWEEYDASKYLCFAFRKKGDMRKGKVLLDLGNMCGGYGYDMHGVHFKNSEAAYICGMFSDSSPEHIHIQQELIAEGSGFNAKKFIRTPNENKARKDWYSFNRQWMLYVAWQKIQGNEGFRNLLMAIPEGATIIEDSSFQKGSTAAFWGTKNNERHAFYQAVKKYINATEPDATDKDKDKMLLDEFNNFTDYGTYRGSNVMGKILTICRKCLADGAEPPIDYELLKSKHIHLLGKELQF